MPDGYLGEIRMFAGNFAPSGWALCDGQLLAVAKNEALFRLIGTTYGGDGVNSFAMPDMRGRLPIKPGQGEGLMACDLGSRFGVESVTLTIINLPNHNHVFQANTQPAVDNAPAGQVVAAGVGVDFYNEGPAIAPMAMTAISTAGGNQPHSNMMPSLCVNFIIATNGIFPNNSAGA